MSAYSQETINRAYKLSEKIAKLQPIECMGFKCQHAYPDEYSCAECEQDLKGYIISFGEIENKITCPYYIEKSK